MQKSLLTKLMPAFTSEPNFTSSHVPTLLAFTSEPSPTSSHAPTLPADVQLGSSMHAQSKQEVSRYRY